MLVDFFWSPIAHGRIRALDTTAACNVPGVVGLYTFRDLQHNLFGPIIKDEILLAESEVTFIGQPIVVIAAETREAIAAAKKAIKIDIEKLDPIFTIDEAKRRKQFIGPTRRIARGDVNAAFASADHVLEGTWINGGQDHFYLESQAAIAVPGEFDQLTVHMHREAVRVDPDVRCRVVEHHVRLGPVPHIRHRREAAGDAEPFRDSAFQRLGSVGMGVTLTVIKWSKASFISSSTLRHLRSATISSSRDGSSTS